ncbi:TBC domain-containing protein [Blastomyces dermatitidis ER-3]|uniref:TBC domain-containing protein n=1 Tax=Ajellomyces dermatitidis (strain ER-3 / ATCC MYA-2586) TaxID=559297 RepID=A0ABP2F7L8_AJEDR|nr:TBC domain-containing protein [Blastomyces dermatitidis ER-3]EEQ92391.1 TBC domain-containing protein [Blastomyces dermatitidis ER-3]
MDSDKNSSTADCQRASGLSSAQSDDRTNPTFNWKKRKEILDACEARDAHALASLCLTEGGLLQDDLRQAAWPILLGYDPNSDHSTESEWTSLPTHGDEEQVKLDVNRAFVHYPNCQTEKELDGKKQQLSELITKTLRKYPMLCYFQGYHDIAQVLFLVLGIEQASRAFERISLFRIRDYMLPTLAPALKHLHLIPAIIHSTDPKLCSHLSGTKPFFALAATLTLYAHDIQEYADIARLYDFILSHEPVVSIYLFAAIILSRKKELFEIPLDEPEMIHFTLSKLPHPINLDSLIASTMELYSTHPPEKLPFRAWKKIPRCSVLKTSRNLGLQATPEEAMELLEQQKRHLRREELREKAVKVMCKYRRPAGMIGMAVFVGILSYWIMRNESNTMPIWRHCLGRFGNVFHWR